MVYAIDDKNSFNDLEMWLNIVKEINTDKIILGIAANKADLYKKAEVTDQQGKKYAKEIGAEWRSTSSLLDDCGIDELVDVLFNKYLEAKALKKTGSLINQDTIVLKNINNENNRNSGCCGGNKKNTKNVKNIKEAEVIKNPDKYNDDEDF